MANGNKRKCEMCEKEFDVNDLIPITELTSGDGLTPNIELMPNTDGVNKKIIYHCRSCASFPGACNECGKKGWLKENYRSANGIWCFFCSKDCKEKYLNKNRLQK